METSTTVEKLQDGFAAHLDGLLSRAAQLRAAVKVGAWRGGEQAFKNELERCRSSRAFSERHVDSSNVRAVAKLVGGDLGNLELDELERLRKQLEEPLPIVGKPVYQLPPLYWRR